MEYVISITKREINPDYKPKKPYDDYGEQKPFYLEHACLNTTLTEEQFQAIRKAVLEKF